MLLWGLTTGAGMLWAEGEPAPSRIVASVVGPHNVTYLPVDIIKAIDADKAEGGELVLRYADGGGIALKELNNRNSDFAITGLPAQMSQRASGGKVVVVAAVNDLPLFVLLVRKALQEEVKRPADLRGRVVGVATSSITAKTTAKQLSELYIKADGLKNDEVRFIPTGQNWETREGLFRTGRVDAMMTEEPFATRLIESGLAYELVNTMNPEDAKRIPGGGFLFATLATRQDVIDENPAMVARMVRMLRRSLEWLSQHTPEETVDVLNIRDAMEKRLLLNALQRYKRLYSPDGEFSNKQIQESELFFRATSEGQSGIPLTLNSMINDQWSGRRE